EDRRKFYRLLTTEIWSSRTGAMADRAPETRSDWARRRLRTALLPGEAPPGTTLRAEDLAERWQVSPTPLREAFQRLGGARLVEVSPQRGVRVAEFTLEDAAAL